VILVLVGLHAAGFDRLVRAADQLAALIPEEVLIQKGSSMYEPSHATCFDFTSAEHLEQLAAEARLIVTHAAAGSVLLAARLGRPLVLVPRLKQFGEALDDHQQQLARALAMQYRVPVVSEVCAESLFESLQRAGQQKAILSADTELAQALRQQLSDWEQARELQTSHQGG
jgi:beta-1,4-N-acetylglucosaminyltransferase